LKERYKKVSLRGAKPSSKISSPFPFLRGRGIKGIGLYKLKGRGRDIYRGRGWG
jgi:hypothetical protein